MSDNRVDSAVKELIALSKSEAMHYNNPSIPPTFALRVLKDYYIEEKDLEDLFHKLNRIPFPKSKLQSVAESSLELALLLTPINFSKFSKAFGLAGPDSHVELDYTYANWFFSLCKPTGMGSKNLREWLVEKNISFDIFQLYTALETKDKIDFIFGFLLGVSKSLVYDNIKGIYDLLKLSVEINPLIIKSEIEEFDKLVKEYQRESKNSFSQAMAKTVEFSNQISISYLNNKPFAELERITDVGIYLTELRIIILNFCINPFERSINGEISKIYDILNQLLSYVDEEAKEYKQAKSIITYVRGKYDKSFQTKVLPLLLEYRYFEAGAVFGEMLANIAQIIAGVIMLLWNARKIILGLSKLPVNLSKKLLAKLSLISISNRTKVIGLLATITFSPVTLRRIPIIYADSPVIALMLKNEKKLYVNLVDSLNKGLPFVESGAVGAIDIEVAKHLAPTKEAISGVDLIKSSLPSNNGLKDPFVFSYAGIFVAMTPRRRKSNGSNEDEGFIAVIITRLQELYQSSALSAFLNTAEKEREILTVENYFRQIAEESKITFPKGATPESILKLIVDKEVIEFEKKINSYKVKPKRNAIWTLFNSHINKKIRPIAEALKNKGAIILIDQKFNALTEKILNIDAVIVFRGKELKVRQLMEMPVMDFYERLYPEKGMKKKFLQAIESIKDTHPTTYALYEERSQALLDIEHALKENQPQNIIDNLTERHGGISEAINNKLENLLRNKSISNKMKDSLQMYQYGKINPYGKCGMTRPDIGFVNVFEGTNNYDLVHVSKGASPSGKHLIGSDFYLDFELVLFGDTPLGTSTTQDIPYTFSDGFLDSLPE